MMCQFEVVGVRFHAEAFKEAQVVRGDRVTLRPEPENPYDRFAIAVYKEERRVGYVPRHYTGQIHKAIADKIDYDVCVESAWGMGFTVTVNEVWRETI